MMVEGNRVLTYQDFVKGLDAKGNFVHRVINLATQTNEMLEDMTVIEANNGTALETTFRTETAKPVWTTYYSGVTASKGSKAKLKVTTGKMGTKIVVDKELFDKAKLKGQSYADAILEDEITSKKDGMRMEMGNTIIYGKLANEPRSFNGLFEHYNAYGDDSLTDDRKSEFYVMNAFGLGKGAKATSENALGSIALVTWAPDAITAFHAEGATTGGITLSEKRVVDVDDDYIQGATYEAYQQYLYWELGLAVRDFRCGGRICNLQRDDMLNKASGETSVEAALRYIELIDRLACRVHEGGKQAWYMDRLMWEKITTLFSRVTRANAYTEEQVDGVKKRFLKGIPVRVQECMKCNEEKVAAAV